MDVVRLLHRSVYVLVYTRPFGAAVFAGMKLLQELGRGRGGLAASAPCGGAKDAVTSVGVVSPVRRRLARKTSVEEGQMQSLGTPSGAVSPLKRRLTRKTSVEDGQLPASGSPLLQKASSLERAAKARRLAESVVEKPLEESYLGSLLEAMALEVVGVREQSMPRPRSCVLLQIRLEASAISRRSRQCKRRPVRRSASVLRGLML